jgi:hypothetical protein
MTDTTDDEQQSMEAILRRIRKRYAEEERLKERDREPSTLH